MKYNFYLQNIEIYIHCMEKVSKSLYNLYKIRHEYFVCLMFYLIYYLLPASSSLLNGCSSRVVLLAFINAYRHIVLYSLSVLCFCEFRKCI